jgi:hypothetical protein
MRPAYRSIAKSDWSLELAPNPESSVGGVSRRPNAA